MAVKKKAIKKKVAKKAAAKKVTKKKVKRFKKEIDNCREEIAGYLLALADIFENGQYYLEQEEITKNFISDYYDDLVKTLAKPKACWVIDEKVTAVDIQCHGISSVGLQFNRMCPRCCGGIDHG